MSVTSNVLAQFDSLVDVTNIVTVAHWNMLHQIAITERRAGPVWTDTSLQKIMIENRATF